MKDKCTFRVTPRLRNTTRLIFGSFKKMQLRTYAAALSNYVNNLCAADAYMKPADWFQFDVSNTVGTALYRVSVEDSANYAFSAFHGLKITSARTGSGIVLAFGLYRFGGGETPAVALCRLDTETNTPHVEAVVGFNKLNLNLLLRMIYAAHSAPDTRFPLFPLWSFSDIYSTRIRKLRKWLGDMSYGQQHSDAAFYPQGTIVESKPDMADSEPIQYEVKYALSLYSTGLRVTRRISALGCPLAITITSENVVRIVRRGNGPVYCSDSRQIALDAEGYPDVELIKGQNRITHTWLSKCTERSDSAIIMRTVSRKQLDTIWNQIDWARLTEGLPDKDNHYPKYVKQLKQRLRRLHCYLHTVKKVRELDEQYGD